MLTQLRRTARPRPGTLHATKVAMADTVLHGLVYTANFRAEEEWGLDEVRNALTGREPRRVHLTDDGRHHAVRFEDVNGIMLSTHRLPDGRPRWGQAERWGEWTETTSGESYADHFDAELRAPAEFVDVTLRRRTVDQLRTLAVDRGLERPLPRRKQELVERVAADMAPDGPLENWPGWFADGVTLVLRADDGPAADTVSRLADALDAGRLGVGDGRHLNAAGLFLYDPADETEELVREREMLFDWFDECEADIAPVRELLAGKYRVLSLSRVRDDDDGVRRWWANIYSANPRGVVVDGVSHTRFYGWFSREELRSEAFVEQAIAAAGRA